ncbi:YczE/YyaS/YitT family protein [Niallia sp. BSM11]|uniref:YczE/YyaS/YitT family protein n=1 Tax=Niallia sp. BSM11 TaxID=3391576 RepID=UPI0039848857
MRPNKITLIMMLLGITLIGFCIAVFRLIAFGTDPYSTMNLGFTKFTHLSYGTTQLVVNLVLLLFQLCFAKKTMGIGSFINLILLAYLSDYFLLILNAIPLNYEILHIRILLLLVSLICLTLAISLYTISDLGIAPYDCLSIYMSERWGIKYHWCRIMTDSTCIAFAFLLDSEIGVITFFLALCTGPFVAYFNKNVSIPLRLKYDGIYRTAHSLIPPKANEIGGGA